MTLTRSLESNPVEHWARVPERARKALDLLADSRARDVETAQRYAIRHSVDPETVHLAVSILWEGGCSGCFDGDLCPLGEELTAEAFEAYIAYLDAVDTDDELPALEVWDRAEARFMKHREQM